MPKCVICGQRFWEGSMYDPPEGCACGEELSAADVDEFTDVDEMRDKWRERLREDYGIDGTTEETSE